MTRRKRTTKSSSDGEVVPDPEDRKSFENWLSKSQPAWAIVIAARAALRVLPLAPPRPLSAQSAKIILLPVFRATSVARFAAMFPGRDIDLAANEAANVAIDAAAANDAGYTAASASWAADAVAAAASCAFACHADAGKFSYAADAVTYACSAAAVVAAVAAAARTDAEGLALERWTPERLAHKALWPARPHLLPPRIGGAWQGVSAELRQLGSHWQVWVDWYDEVLAGSPEGYERSEPWEAAFTDVNGSLLWRRGAEWVNAEIGRRLEVVSRDSIKLTSSIASDESGWRNKSGKSKGSKVKIAKPPHSSIGKAVRRNKTEIVCLVEPLLVLIDEKIRFLLDERPNSDEARTARKLEIIEQETLKRNLIELRDTSLDFAAGKVREKTVIVKTKTLTDGIGSWWANNHAKICNKALDAALFTGCVGICSLVGSGGPLTVAASAALIGGKPVIEALKSLSKKWLPRSGQQ